MFWIHDEEVMKKKTCIMSLDAKAHNLSSIIRIITTFWRESYNLMPCRHSVKQCKSSKVKFWVTIQCISVCCIWACVAAEWCPYWPCVHPNIKTNVSGGVCVLLPHIIKRHGQYWIFGSYKEHVYLCVKWSTSHPGQFSLMTLTCTKKLYELELWGFHLT